MKKLLFVALMLAGLLHAENSIGIDVNNADVEVLGSVDINALADYANGTTYILDLNYLHTEGDNMTSLGFSGQNSLHGVESLTLAFGLRSVLASDFLAFPFMVKAIYDLALIDAIPPTSLVFNFAYAPSVLAFRDADNYLSFRAELNMQIISNIDIFTGYRNIDTRYEEYDKTFNDSFYFGMKLSF
jgi:hypothetical protein